MEKNAKKNKTKKKPKQNHGAERNLLYHMSTTGALENMTQTGSGRYSALL